MDNLSPQRLTREMSKVDQIRDMLGAADDAAAVKLFLDTVEGETGALECVDALIEVILADELLAEKATARASRLETRAKQARATLLQVMDEKLRMSKLVRPLATLSVGKTIAQPRVTNAEQLPDVYIRHTVDLNKLGKALRDGERIVGAELSNPRPMLTVRAT